MWLGGTGGIGRIGLLVFALSFLIAPERAEASASFVSLTVEHPSIVANDTDVQTVRLVVSTTQSAILDSASIAINYPVPGRPNYARGYFQWTTSTGFRELGWDHFGIRYVTLRPEDPANPSAGSERVNDAVAGTVTFVFRWTARPSYGVVPGNDVWYSFGESATGFREEWTRSGVSFFVTGVHPHPEFLSLSVDRNLIVANGQDMQTARLLIWSARPDLIDDVNIMVNYPVAGQTNPVGGHFQWGPWRGFRKLGGPAYGSEAVDLLPPNPANPALGSERIIHTASSTVEYIFRWTAHSSYGVINDNDIAYRFAEMSTGFSRWWSNVQTNFAVAAPAAVDVSLHPNSQNSRQFIAGTLGNRLTDFSFAVAFNAEPVEIDSLTLTQNVLDTASSSFMDYTLVYITDQSGAVVGSAVPTSTAVFIDIAPGAVMVTSTTRLAIRANLSLIALNANVTIGGHMLGYNIAETGHVGTFGTQSQQPAIVFFRNPMPIGDTHLMYKGIPTVSNLSIPPILSQGADMFKVKVSAGSGGGDIGLYKFTFDISTSSATTTLARVTGLDFVDVTDSANEVLLYSNHAPSQSGKSIVAEIYLPQEVTVVPSHPRIFALRGNFSGFTNGDTVSTRLAGDAAFHPFATLMAPAALIELAPHNDFIWSDRHQSLHSTQSNDWTNGYLVSGLAANSSTARTLVAP